MQGIKVHDVIKPISWLIGNWVTTEGYGSYPTMKNFKYHEKLEFSSVGQPMLNFQSTSNHPETKAFMHQERGFLRIKPGTDQLAFIVSHNFGLTSIEEGTCKLDPKEIVLKSTSISRIPFAKDPAVKSFERSFKLVSPDTLEVVMSMETSNTPLTLHLTAVYKKVEA